MNPLKMADTATILTLENSENSVITMMSHLKNQILKISYSTQKKIILFLIPLSPLRGIYSILFQFNLFPPFNHKLILGFIYDRFQKRYSNKTK